jgi:hypothetical protein
MGQSYTKNKIHIYNYRAKDTEKYNEYMRALQKRLRIWRNIKKEFLSILLS